MNRTLTLNRSFKQVAEAVTRRLTELFAAQVVVVDEQGTVVVESPRSPFERPLRATDTNSATLQFDLRVPLDVDGQFGEVMMTVLDSNERISPRLARVLVELIISQTAAVTRLLNQTELKNKFIHDLLRNPTGEEADILREAEILGLDFSRPRAVILIDATDYLASPQTSALNGQLDALTHRRIRLIISSIVSFFQLPDDTICAYIGGSEIAVLKASSTQDLVAWTAREDMPGQANPSWANLTALKRASNELLNRLRNDTGAAISIGIGRYHPGIRGLASSYQDARAALFLGHRFRGQNQVHCLDGLGIAAFVGIADESTKLDLARYLLSPLDQEPELIETLEAFFLENCYPSSTANRLSIHRNTLSYRLDKITSLTGLNPRQFDEAMQIRLALLLRSLLVRSHNISTQPNPTQLGNCPIFSELDSEHLRQLPNVSFG